MAKESQQKGTATPCQEIIDKFGSDYGVEESEVDEAKRLFHEWGMSWSWMFIQAVRDGHVDTAAYLKELAIFSVGSEKEWMIKSWISIAQHQMKDSKKNERSIIDKSVEKIKNLLKGNS